MTSTKKRAPRKPEVRIPEGPADMPIDRPPPIEDTPRAPSPKRPRPPRELEDTPAPNFHAENAHPEEFARAL